MSVAESTITQEQIQGLLETGVYANAVDVVAEAVSVLYEYTSGSIELDAKIESAIAQLDRGEGIPWSPSLREEIRREADESDMRGEPIDSDG